MGPRAFAHGDGWVHGCKTFSTSPLQWGRGLSPTETRSWGEDGSGPIPASMGPRAFAHGDPQSNRRPHCLKDRFNGAAGFRPRRPFPLYSSALKTIGLQWGRGLSPTETCNRPKTTTTLFMLQWGRGLSPTETYHTKRETSSGLAASMGPRAFAHGDGNLGDHRQDRGLGFNGAAGFRPRRPPRCRLSPGRLDGLQWGRGLSPTETTDLGHG